MGNNATVLRIIYPTSLIREKNFLLKEVAIAPIRLYLKGSCQCTSNVPYGTITCGTGTVLYGTVHHETVCVW